MTAPKAGVLPITQDRPPPPGGGARYRNEYRIVKIEDGRYILARIDWTDHEITDVEYPTELISGSEAGIKLTIETVAMAANKPVISYTDIPEVLRPRVPNFSGA